MPAIAIAPTVSAPPAGASCGSVIPVFQRRGGRVVAGPDRCACPARQAADSGAMPEGPLALAWPAADQRLLALVACTKLVHRVGHPLIHGHALCTGGMPADRSTGKTTDEQPPRRRWGIPGHRWAVDRPPSGADEVAAWAAASRGRLPAHPATGCLSLSRGAGRGRRRPAPAGGACGTTRSSDSAPPDGCGRCCRWRSPSRRRVSADDTKGGWQLGGPILRVRAGRVAARPQRWPIWRP